MCIYLFNINELSWRHLSRSFSFCQYSNVVNYDPNAVIIASNGIVGPIVIAYFIIAYSRPYRHVEYIFRNSTSFSLRGAPPGGWYWSNELINTNMPDDQQHKID